MQEKLKNSTTLLGRRSKARPVSPVNPVGPDSPAGLANPAGRVDAIKDNNGSRADFLLDVAAKSFLEKGFEATSVGEIARLAHASKETFYSKFTNKSELFRAVIRRLMDRFASDVSSALVTERAPQKALTQFGSIILERLLSDEGIGIQNIVFMESRRFPEVAAIFYEFGPERTLAALAKYFDAQVKHGALRRMISSVAAAHFMGLLTSDIMMLRSLGLLNTPTAEQKAARVHAAVDVFLRAYGRER